MDNLKIHDSEFSNGKRSLIVSHLDQKLNNLSVSTQENSKIKCLERGVKKVMPKYQFKITSYSIGENVQYEIQLIESFKVFRKTITEVFKFRTRYSKLEALHKKVGGKDFPSKKLFGNKNKQFVQKRMKELQVYLNGLCADKSHEFLKFILQIKQINLEICSKTPFRLPA